MTTLFPTDEDLDNIREYIFHHEGKIYAKKKYGRGDKRKEVGQEVGWDNGRGYRQVYFFGRHYMVHRIIYFLHNGRYPELEVDYINGDGLDNRPQNLREVSRVDNLRSFHKPRVGGRYTSKYRGVSLHRPTGTWRARLMLDYGEKSLGYFTCEKEAALMWNIAAKESGFSKESFNKVFENVEVGTDD